MQYVRPDFRLTPTNIRSVAALCRKLEGIPLALVLVAPRLDVLTPAEALKRLESRALVLEDRRHDALPRHRSLHAALDWSYASLDENCQRFFRRLAVFPGGWTLDMAEQICQEPLAVDYLAELRDYFLLRVTENSDTLRFSFLETVRDFASMQPEPERDADRYRHKTWFLQLAEEADPHLIGPEAPRWLQIMEREQDNLRAALHLCRERAADADKASGLRLACALRRFWYRRGYNREASPGSSRCWSSTPMPLPRYVPPHSPARGTWPTIARTM